MVRNRKKYSRAHTADIPSRKERYRQAADQYCVMQMTVIATADGERMAMALTLAGGHHRIVGCETAGRPPTRYRR